MAPKGQAPGVGLRVGHRASEARRERIGPAAPAESRKVLISPLRWARAASPRTLGAKTPAHPAPEVRGAREPGKFYSPRTKIHEEPTLQHDKESFGNQGCWGARDYLLALPAEERSARKLKRFLYERFVFKAPQFCGFMGVGRRRARPR